MLKYVLPNRQFQINTLVMLLFVLSPTTLVQAQPEDDIPNEIIIEHHNLFPEGIEYDEPGERFLLSSASEGTIYQVADDGTISAFIEDDDLTSTLGIEIDHINNRLLVANGDSSFVPNTAMLGAYDLETGERLFFVDLSAVYPADAHLANDVTVDSEGIAYVTDSFAPVIYRVDMDGEVSVFIEDEAFVFLNGIVAHPDGYLIVGTEPGKLFKIPLEEPEAIPIDLADNIRFGIVDGMILLPDGSLVFVTFPNSLIYQLSSDDDWMSAVRVARSTGIAGRHAHGWATTVALRGDSVYTIYSHLNNMVDGRDRDIFEIVLVEFEAD